MSSVASSLPSYRSAEDGFFGQNAVPSLSTTASQPGIAAFTMTTASAVVLDQGTIPLNSLYSPDGAFTISGTGTCKLVGPSGYFRVSFQCSKTSGSANLITAVVVKLLRNASPLANMAYQVFYGGGSTWAFTTGLSTVALLPNDEIFVQVFASAADVTLLGGASPFCQLIIERVA